MNLYHDELGRFCSRNGMISRKHVLIDEGRDEEASQIDLGLRNADLTRDIPEARKRENFFKKAYRKALKDKDEEQVDALKKEFYSTDEGIVELQRDGKHSLAKAYFMRRESLARKDRKNALVRKKPLRMALDVDNTSGDFTQIIRDHVAKENGLTPEEAKERFPDPSSYCMAEAGWFETKQDFMTALRTVEDEGGYRRLRPYNNVKRTIQTLVAEKDVEIHVVTARGQAWNEDTRAWLRKTGIPFKSITHTESKEKVQGMDVFIDDSDKQITTLQAHGRNVITFDNPYNSHLPSQHRVKNWDDVPAVIHQIRNTPSNA